MNIFDAANVAKSMAKRDDDIIAINPGVVRLSAERWLKLTQYKDTRVESRMYGRMLRHIYTWDGVDYVWIEMKKPDDKVADASTLK